MIDEHGLAAFVAFIHAADLRDGGVALIHEQQEIPREEVQQRVRPRAGLAAGKMARVVLDALAESHLGHHFQIVVGPHPQALGFDEFALLLELRDLLVRLLPDRQRRALHLVARRDELLRGEERVVLQPVNRVTGQRVDAGNALHLVVEKFHPDRRLVEVGGMDLDHIPADPEFPAAEGDVVPLEQHADERVQQLLARQLLPDPHWHHHVRVVLGRAEAVDAGNRRHHDRVLPRQQRAHRAQPQPLDLVIDRGILLDVGVAPRDVGLGLEVVEVGDEILDGVVREEVLEFRVKLRRQRLVVAHDQRRLAVRFDEVRHREGLARAGDAEQRLVAISRRQRLRKLGDGLPLVALRLVVAHKFE